MFYNNEIKSKLNNNQIIIVKKTNIDREIYYLAKVSGNRFYHVQRITRQKAELLIKLNNVYKLNNNNKCL